MHGNAAAQQRRVMVILNHLSPSISSNSRSVELSPSASACQNGDECQKNQNGIRWNGWGYSDTEFQLTEDGQLTLTGSRYPLSGKVFQSFRNWSEESMGVDFSQESTPQKEMADIPKPIINDYFMKDLKDIETPTMINFTFDDYVRLFHGHGHTCQEIYKLRFGSFKRIPDIVIFPCDSSQVLKVVELANKHNVCIIPFGGGTNVTRALECPEKERRMIISLDMKLMNKIKWIDRKSNTACIEAGAVGSDLDQRLHAEGYCLGHEPDSFEFSSLGGWIATRASGMKKNHYGNIEDILIQVELVTPIGTMIRQSLGPRQSIGPDINQIVLGSEGIFGVITQAVLRIKPLPEAQLYDSVVFPNFKTGLDFYEEVTRSGCVPASMRLVDNTQFQFSQALKPASETSMNKALDLLKKFYVVRIKGFDVNEMVAVTLVFEGSKENVDRQRKKIYGISRKYHGLIGGEENGKRGFFLTYLIAYLRDFGFNYNIIGESFETAVPWTKVSLLCDQVKQKIKDSCAKKGVLKDPFISLRVTQTYEAGVCVYFYFAFDYRGLQDPVNTFSEVEDEAREEVIKCGGSLSHHHGVGKIRKKWVSDAVSKSGVEVFRAIKRRLDPKNLFVSGNLFDV